MASIDVNDRVVIIQVGPNEQQLLNKKGRVLMISDGRICVIALDSGEGATVDISQLKKL